MTQNKIALSVGKIAKLEVLPGRDQSIYWDSKTPGLGIRVTRSGSRSFIFETSFNGKTLRITIGNISIWSIAQAQAEARRLKVMTDQGIDPRERREELRQVLIANRLKQQLALDAWMEYVNSRKISWSERHFNDHLQAVRKGGDLITRGKKSGDLDTKRPGILLDLLSRPLIEINRDLVLSWIRNEVGQRPARVRLALALLKAFLGWAGDQSKYQSFLAQNVCSRLSKEIPAQRPKTDCLQVEQLGLWFNTVKKIPNQITSAYLQTLLLTGGRRNEIAAVKWVDIDFIWRVITIRDKVDGLRQIPLTPYVHNLLLNLPRVNDYVFSSPSAKSGRIEEPRKAHNSAVSLAGLPELSVHGLRRSFGTLAEWVECPAGISAQIMGHKPSAIAERHYRRRPIDLLRKWHSKIELFILEKAHITQPAENSRVFKLVS